MTDSAVWEKFRASFDAESFVPGDPGYDEARAVWNGDIDRRPALIVRPTDRQQTAEAIGFARTAGVEVTVRGGGHSYAGHAVRDGAMMIDLSALNQVEVDPQARRARCGGGTTWADLDAATQEHGLALPGGFISHTGVAGLTLGGGIGWLSPRAGLSCDNLVSAEVVTADGRTVTASPGSNPDLFWALRGGGGNFGIVTTFEFALHEVTPLVQMGMFFWDADHARDGLRFSRDLIPNLPETAGVLLAGLSAPPEPFVPEKYQGQPGIALVIIGWASPEEHARMIEPVLASAPEPQWHLITPIPYIQLQRMFDGSTPWGILAYEKALYLDELSDDAIDVVAHYVPQKASPLSFVPVFPMRGAFSRVGDDDTAFGGRRDIKWVFNISAECPSPELLEHDRAWVREFWAALRPHASGSGTYVNFLADTDEDRVRSSYGDQKYERLARIKSQWDPDNVFRYNANIHPGTPPT
ncbi:FAD-binding oxidoreductase [Pseudarthrobacter sp. NPDC080039]|uniref:FAD-binding oxidoreductase n=1 Tax=unclassified Pseudarthrobacter TaxID=2647000 RepID=UPI00344BC692